MINRTMWISLTLALLGFVPVAHARAAQSNDRTVLTFSQPVEVPGHVLPAGTYVFKLLDSTSDRHIVQIFNADESQIMATIMAIPDYRLVSTDETLVKFTEVPSGSPEAIRAWFHPGNTVGQAFVYPKPRAGQLARLSNTTVPAIAVDVASDDELETAPIVAITPDEQEVPVTAAIQTTPTANMATMPDASSSMAGVEPARQLPQTASALPLITLLGVGLIGIAISLMLYGKHATA